MNILLLGSGGREHALAYKITQSPRCTQLYTLTGNAGTAQVGENLTLNANENDFEQIANIILSKNIEMVVVGSEEYLVKGLRDFLENHPEIKTFFVNNQKTEKQHLSQENNPKKLTFIGAGKDGAILEGSKDFSKKFMQKYQIPTAKYATFSNDEFIKAKEYLEKHPLPIVLKADGLAQGKGVIICETHEKAVQNMREMLLQAKFGEASAKVVVEEFLQGVEVSMFVLVDGQNYVLFPEAKDYKRIGEGDTGLNTGGMGAVSPVMFVDNDLLEKVKTQIITPTLYGLKKENINYQGFIFLGLMIAPDKNPFVIEYNVRLGDPETEAILPRIESDLVEILEAVGNQNLDKIQLKISPNTAVTTVIVSGGYPENYEKNKKIEGVFPLSKEEKHIFTFHAGTKKPDNEQQNNEQQDKNTDKNVFLTNGGRVIALTALGNTLEEARTLSQLHAKNIAFDKSYFRGDIGLDLVDIEKHI